MHWLPRFCSCNGKCTGETDATPSHKSKTCEARLLHVKFRIQFSLHNATYPFSWKSRWYFSMSLSVATREKINWTWLQIWRSTSPFHLPWLTKPLSFTFCSKPFPGLEFRYFCGSPRRSFYINGWTSEVQGKISTHKHQQICGIVPGLGGRQTLVMCFFGGGPSLWGEKHINKIPQKILGQSRENYVYVCFSFCVFRSQDVV